MSKPLDEWIKENRVSPEMIWKRSAHKEFRDFFEFADILGGVPRVISTHRSKSIVLPVMEVETPYGIRCVVRDNFHDIKVSVWCPEPCDHDLFGLPAGSDTYLHPVYFEGFEKEWIHEPFVLGNRKFSACLGYRTFLPFAKALRWKFEPEKEDGPRKPKFPDDPWFLTELSVRANAENCLFPVLYHMGTITRLIRFFRPSEPMPPNEDLLRRAMVRQGVGYGDEPNEDPLPYMSLDFTSGCPEPVDDWLRTLDRLTKERREDDSINRLGDKVGARVNVYRMTPELRARTEELGCLELLKPNDER